MIIETLEVDIDALQLLPESNPIMERDVQLGCGVTRVRICELGTCNFAQTCSNRTFVF